jgi:aminopeptidase N
MNDISRILIAVLLMSGVTRPLIGQDNSAFSLADTLRGALRPERTCYNVHYYELQVLIDPATKSISGSVAVHFHVMEDFERLQLDLYKNMQIDRVEAGGKELDFERIEDAVFVQTPTFRKGERGVLHVVYGGKPIEAANAPWDGGFVWKKDKAGRPWIGVACQGDGASLWWPCKDHLSDEPDSMRIRLTVPQGLTAVSNGRFEGLTDLKNGYMRFDWLVTYPINTYNVTANVAAYAFFQDRYISNSDTLELHYYVLEENLEKAKVHFKQVHDVLRAFEHYFGPYPFWEDTYKLVETPYLGMEHQSAIAYGNLYRRGYLGGNIPSDMHFDYIILHETGHEYFGNAVSVSDLADMWIHESFTTYMESLYVEYTMGYEAAMRYLTHQRAFISNKQAIVGQRGVNWYKRIKSTDQYYKGAWMLNTLRHIVNNDSLWFATLRGFYDKYKYDIVVSEDFFAYAEKQLKMDLHPFFNQYLYQTGVPELEYRIKKRKDGWHFSYKLKAEVSNLALPVRINVAGKEVLILVDESWKEMWLPITKESELEFDHSKYYLMYRKR